MENRQVTVLAAILLAVTATCSSYSAASGQSTVASEHKADENLSSDQLLINRWYYEGCLTGCSRGYIIGYSVGRSKANKDRATIQSPPDSLTSWPECRYQKAIENELNDILSNEPREKSSVSQLEQSEPRYISSPRQLPIRRAGIYSAFHTAVHDGFEAGYNAQAGYTSRPDLFGEANKSLQKFTETHPSHLPKKVESDLIWSNRIVPGEG